MKKRILTFLCISVMALAMAGCDDKKEDKKEDKTTETTQESVNDLTIDIGGDTEEIIIEPDDTEEVIPDSDWITGGSDRTGYVDVPADWVEYESTEDGGELYALQYVAPGEYGIISVVDNHYDFNNQVYDVEDPAAVIIEAYVQRHEDAGGYNISTDEVVMDGVTFNRAIDCIPQGNLDGYDYDYYLYTYVTYINDRFYTLIVEGEEATIEEPVKVAEDTFTFGDDVSDEELPGDITTTDYVIGNTDWESYEIVVDGDACVLPCDFSEFESNGWTVAEYYAEDVVEYEDYIYISIVKGDKEASIIISNQYETADISPSQGQVVGVVMDFNLEGTNSSIAGGVTLGTSYEDVISTLGSPDDMYEDDEDDFKILTYESLEYEDDYFSGLSINISDGVVSEIEIKHW